MASIRYNPNGQKGRISYNTDIVSGIIALSLQETEGIELVPSRSKGIKVNFEKEGIFADISVIAHYGYSVPELAFAIQQTVKQMVESMTKYRIARWTFISRASSSPSRRRPSCRLLPKVRNRLKIGKREEFPVRLSDGVFPVKGDT